MIETNIPEINVDELMEQIRAEVKKRKEGGGAFHRTVPHANNGTPSSFYSKIDLSGICPMPDPEPFEIKESYHAHDFLKYHGRHFVRNVYRGVLKREPDSNGLEFFLEELRAGKLTKAEVLGRLRYCREGRPKKVQVKGLSSTFLIQSSFRIPVLGYLFRIVVGIANFPAILRNLQVMEESTFAQLQQQRSNLSGALSQLEPVLERMADREELVVLKDDVHAAVEIKADREELIVLKDDVHAAVEIKADREELVVLKDDVHAAVEIKANREELVVLKDDIDVALDSKANNEQIQGITSQIREILRQTRDHKLNILDQQRRLKLLLEEARKRLPEPFSGEQLENLVSEEDHLHDAMYVSFEDQFRGTRGDIKKRLGVYLPYMEKAGAGSKEAPILDAGCGRGEWLELCKDNNLEACGVDINRVMVAQCGEAGFDVAESDVITFLRDQKTNSIGAVTGFHIIEHLPLYLLIAFIDEAYRVVKPGGVVIFETPNPENILVGSCNFYFDPTHRNPLPPLISQFLLESRGLSQIEVKRLHPYDEDFQIADENTETSRRLNKHFYGSQDYAVIGFKIQ